MCVYYLGGSIARNEWLIIIIMFSSPETRIIVLTLPWNDSFYIYRYAVLHHHVFRARTNQTLAVGRAFLSCFFLFFFRCFCFVLFCFWFLIFLPFYRNSSIFSSHCKQCGEGCLVGCNLTNSPLDATKSETVDLKHAHLILGFRFHPNWLTPNQNWDWDLARTFYFLCTFITRRHCKHTYNWNGAIQNHKPVLGK